MANNGTGAFFYYSTAANLFEITGINGPNITGVDIETTHLGTTGARTFMPGDLVDNGEISMNVLYDPTVAVTMITTSNCTVGYPLTGAQTVPTKKTFSGYIKSYDSSVPLEDKMTGTVVVKISGVVTTTNGS